jgi:hypothetical protein
MSIITKHTVSVPLNLSPKPSAGVYPIWDGDRFTLSNKPNSTLIVSNSAVIQNLGEVTSGDIYIGQDPYGYSANAWTTFVSSSYDLNYFNCLSPLPDANMNSKDINCKVIISSIGDDTTGILYLFEVDVCDTLSVNLATQSFSTINGSITCAAIKKTNSFDNPGVGLGIEVTSSGEATDLKFSYSINSEYI